jgi:hypothetical protein
MSAPAPRGLIYAMAALIAAIVITVTIMVLRWYYAKQLEPSKDHPNGRIVAEFWTEAGPRIHELCDIQPNGWEIRREAGKKNPRYFFHKEDKGSLMWPLNPILPFEFIKTRADVVSFYENEPEAINPRRKNSILTAERLDAVRDDDALEFANSVDEKMAENQQKLLDAVDKMPDKNMLYILLIVSTLISAISAILIYMDYNALKRFIGS